MTHHVDIEVGASGCWGYCACGWSTGPCTNRDTVLSDHDMHIAQGMREAVDEADLIDWLDAEFVDDDTEAITLEEYRLAHI